MDEIDHLKFRDKDLLSQVTWQNISDFSTF